MLTDQTEEKNVTCVWANPTNVQIYLSEKREKFLGRSSSQTDFLKSPPSPVLRLPPAVSSADFIKEEDAAGKDSVQGFLQRTSALRRSLGLRGSKRNHKDKRTSSVF